MKNMRLAIVRQKYRPTAARSVLYPALEALDNRNLELNVITRSWQGAAAPGWHIHVVNPPKWGRISRERGFANAARACWQNEKFDIVQSHERIAGCDIFGPGTVCTAAGCYSGRGYCPPGGQNCCLPRRTTVM